MFNLIYIHIGSPLPDCIFDNLYQTLLISDYSTKVFMIMDDSLIDDFYTKFNNYNLNIYTNQNFHYKNIVQTIPISLLDRLNNNEFENYKQTISNFDKNTLQFRDGFWITTTARFYYINILIEMFNLKNVFHIENDVMLYDSPSSLYKSICDNFKLDNIQKICMVQDAPNRVIPSLLFFPNSDSSNELVKFMTNTLRNSETFMNDMDILGKYEDKYMLPIFPTSNNFIFDGAAIGQYLGGVDYKNFNGTEIQRINNPSKGFVNETSIMKPDQYNFSKSNVIFDHLKIPLKIPILTNKTQENLTKIANLHIHSKQLYQFSSVFDLQFDDIITGDRILGLCDFVIVTKEIYNYHLDISKYAKDIILVNDFNKINLPLLNKYFVDFCEKYNTNTIKLFVYTHILKHFQNFILPHLNKNIEFVLYLHNSDHTFDNSYDKLLNSDVIKHVYAQNDITNHEKVSLLPIGIANSMWKHGDLLELYNVMQVSYKYMKTKSIYVNINPSTYSYRKDFMEKINKTNNFEISSNKPYKEYLKELSSHRFCLCIRGNGVDTHRFWESLYLGVIPVIINNKTTNYGNFVKQLRKLEIPFYEINLNELDDIVNKYNNDYFNEELFNSFMDKSSIFNINSLKLSFYKNT